MNPSFEFRDLIQAHGMALYLLFAPPERPWRCPVWIPAGDTFNSRGQRPRKTHPQQDPTLKGSNRGEVLTVSGHAVRGSATPSGSRIKRHVFRGRCPRLLTCALAGRKNFAFGSHDAPLVASSCWLCGRGTRGFSCPRSPVTLNCLQHEALPPACWCILPCFRRLKVGCLGGFKRDAFSLNEG